MNYESLKNKKSHELKIIDNEILSAIKNMPTPLTSYFEKFLFNGAKRLRPLFGLFVCDLLNIVPDKNILNFLVGIELIHNSSLIHDDILDDGKIRRNMPCIHLKHGNKTAVLAGDYLLFLAMNFIPKNVLDIILNTCYIMINSELNTLNERYKAPTLEEYIKISKEKTSSLFCAIVSGIEKIKGVQSDKLIYNFTENFSLIFQIRDDINNYLENDIGKKSSDKENGVYTLPFILNGCDIIEEMQKFLDKMIAETGVLLEKYPHKDDLISLLNLLNGENRNVKK